MSRAVIVAMPDQAAGVVGSLLEDLGYYVSRAASLRELGAALTESPGAVAVLSSLAFPDGNWRDLVDQVRTCGSGVPVILCTGAGTAELWWDALECGVLDIIAPPYSVRCLERLLSAPGK